MLQVSDSQEERDEEEAQYQDLRDFIVQHLLEKGLTKARDVLQPILLMPRSVRIAFNADLDIENCCVTLVLQLLEKLCPQPEINLEALEALQLWSGRGKVCREELKVPEIEGKRLVTAVLSGGAPSKEHKDSAFLQKIHKASIFPLVGMLPAAGRLPGLGVER